MGFALELAVGELVLVVDGASIAGGGADDVAGLRVGNRTDLEGLTGCTVVLCPPGTVGSGEVRGGAPGTRETDLLRPGKLVQEVHAVLLTGGSAFGLAAAEGVVRFLEERGIGFDTGVSERGTCFQVASKISFDTTWMQRFPVTTMPATGF